MVEYRSVDYAGNVEDWKSVEFKIDQTPPMIDITVELIDLDVIFTATCFDDISGVDRVEFYIEDELMFTDFESPFQWIPTQPDICPLKVITYDIAGNSNNETSSGSTSHFYHVFGFIFPPRFSATCISFRAVLVFRRWTMISPDGSGGTWVPSVGIISTYLLNRYIGYIGKFFIHATFNNGQYY